MSDGLTGYELREKVATDHLGEIWLALRKDPAGLVRVRIVTFQALNELSVRPRFVDGMTRAFRVRHPGLAAGVEAGVHEERAFGVVEWPDGLTLGTRLRRESRLTQSESLKIAGEVAVALEAGWTSGGLWHGQLTPEGIHLWPEGRVSVLDLGQTGIEPLRASGQVADFLRLLRAVPFYSAPELVRGAASVDFRADVYSLGAILYHMMTGAAPFGDRPPAEALDNHLMGFLDDPCELNRDLSRGAGWLIEKMMSRDPARRHADWASLRADLTAVRNGGDPAGQRPEAGASVIRRGAKRDPGLSAALRQPGAAGRRGGRRGAGAGGGRTPKVVVAGAPTGASATPVASSGSGARLAVIGALLIVGGGLGIREYMKRNQITVDRPRTADEIARENAQRAAASRPVRPDAPPQGPVPGIEDIVGRPDSPPPPRPMPEQLAEIAVDRPGPASPDAPAAPGQKDPLLEHPRFKQAAGLFNMALGLFKEFEASRNPSQLDRVASMSEEAAKLFEQCEPGFPGDRRVRKYVEQCYGLARFARQSLLSSGNLTDGRTSRPPTSPLPAPPSSVQGALARLPVPPPATPPPAVTESLKLGPAWNGPIRVGASLVRELRDLLQSHGKPAVDTDPKPGLLIHPSVPYLEKMDNVTRRLGIPPMGGTGDDLTFPGFPERSLRYFAFDSNSANPPYKGGRLIVDTFGHAVGVQWMDETPAGALALPEEMFAAKWSIVDPIAGRIRERPGHRIAHRVRGGNGVVQIDTEVMDPSAPASSRSLGRYSLQLAQPVVDLMLMRMSTAP